MQIVKERYESKELKLFRYLNQRMDLTEKDKHYHFGLEKGFEGEKNFDGWIKRNLVSNCLILNDLLFGFNNSVAQMDSLMLFQKSFLLFEIKNFEGDYYLENDIWHSASGTVIKDPLEQLKKNDTALRRILQDFGIPFSIESYLLFINPDFTLYNAPRNPSIILPTQLNRFMKKLNNISSMLTEKHSMFAEHLMLRHLTDSPYSNVPSYQFEQMRKGFYCKSGHTLLDLIGEEFVCTVCGCKENLDDAVLRNIEEFVLLFPDRKIKMNTIFDWCSGFPSKKTIRRILKMHYQKYGHGKYSYYL